MTKLKIKMLAVVVAMLLLPMVGLAQDTGLTASSQDTLLEQYLFPISSYLESGAAIGKAASECDSFKYYDSSADPAAWTTGSNCSALTSESGIVQKTGDGKGIYASGVMELSYKFSVSQEGNYDFKIKAANSFDNFANLNDQQLAYIFENSKAATTDYYSYKISDDDSESLTVLEYSDDNVISENIKYEMFRNLIFSVYLDGEEPANKKGYIIIPATDYSKLQDGSILLGNLKPGEHSVMLRFLSDYYFNPSVATLPASLNGFDDINIEAGQCAAGPNATKQCQRNIDCPQSVCNKINNTLDINPVIAGVSINQTSPTTDVIGVRIYTNKEHKDPETWYRENVINPTASVKPVKVDGYQGVQDERTTYISAANIDRSNFFTNIYVMAYNQNAAPPSVTIYKQMMANWVFNKNINEKYPLKNEAEKQKDKLRRDTIRLADIFKLGRILDDYKSNHGGKCPVLDAGTYIKNHSISTWPSWQATLANELGAALPVDPLNIMTTKKESLHDCTDPLDKANCQNICSRNAEGSPLTGCPLSEQCMPDYCAACSSNYDPLTCWDKATLEFYDENVFNGCRMTDSEAYSMYDGALKTGASDCKLGKFNTPNLETHNQPYVNDGAFVYQYVSRDNGQSCSFINRFEYTEQDLCQPGFCYYDNNDTNPMNDCYQPGACLAGCDSLAENCVNNQYKNLYCYLGSWKQSCGDGFLQRQCGEFCDPNVSLVDRSWCDELFGMQDWYNEQSIKASCNRQCTLSEGGNLTIDDCGGFCGDKVVEAKGGEQCDEGLSAAPLKKGSAGLRQDSQYMCSGKGGSSVPVINSVDCVNYSKDWNQQASLSCDNLSSSETRVFKQDNYFWAEGGFRASYAFDLPQSGGYNLQLTAANYADDLTKLTVSQLDYLISQKQPGDNLFNVTPDGGVNIPEYGLIAPDNAKKYDLLKNLIFSVYMDSDYVDSETPGNLVGFIMIPGSNTKQTGSLFIGGLTAGQHTVYLHFVGDHYYYELPTDGSAAQDPLAEVAAGDPGPVALDINPILYSVSMYSPQTAVGNCKTYGGWCGDGQVEMQYGEQCDTKNYLQPSTQQTVNIVFNSGFEGYFTPWQKDSGTVALDTDQYFEGRSSLKVLSSTVSASVSLDQLTNFIPDKDYSISLRLKGDVSSVSFQIGNLSQSKGWMGVPAPLTEVTTELTSGWKYYKLDIFHTPTIINGLSEKFKLIFAPAAGLTLNFNIDDIKIIPEASARPQYQCASDPVSGALCQYRGGYCGDGKIQSNFGENCDDRAGLSCTTDSNCGNTGECTDNVCQSIRCNSFCKSTYCGDGMIQRPNSVGTYETCDFKSDPLCSSDCTHIKMGGECSTDTYGQSCQTQSSPDCRVCASTLSCTIRNYGDSDKKCLGARNSSGCKSDNDCILGYYCDTSVNKCKEEVSTYLRYHPEGISSLNLPKPADTSYDINISVCPDLRGITLGNDTYITDRCTNINWMSSDNITRLDANWSYTDAVSTGCVAPERLPSVAELYSLVKQTNTDDKLPYADKELLKLCPVNCSYDESAGNFCSTQCLGGVTDNYLYWTGTCVEKDNTGCKKALAVNFKYGSIESYPASTALKIRCLKESNCGDGKLDPGESCEFFTTSTGKIEKNIEREYNKICKNFGYDGGALHCDPESCGIRVDNCYLNSQVGLSCQQVCQNKKALDCKSVGLDIAQDTFISGSEPEIANDNFIFDVNAEGSCVGIEVTDACAYTFNNRETGCIDTTSNKPYPYNSEFSFCNCREPAP